MNDRYDDMNLRENISEAIRMYVKTHDITYHQLAMETHITPTKISAYINKSTTPSIQTLLKLCAYMDIDLNTMTGIPKHHQVDTLIDSLDEVLASLNKVIGVEDNETK